MEILMIDWIRKRIIIEKNAERQPKKSGGGERERDGEDGGRNGGGGERARAGGSERGEGKAVGEKEKARANYWE